MCGVAGLWMPASLQRALEGALEAPGRAGGGGAAGAPRPHARARRSRGSTDSVACGKTQNQVQDSAARGYLRDSACGKCTPATPAARSAAHSAWACASCVAQRRLERGRQHHGGPCRPCPRARRWRGARSRCPSRAGAGPPSGAGRCRRAAAPAATCRQAPTTRPPPRRPTAPRAAPMPALRRARLPSIQASWSNPHDRGTARPTDARAVRGGRDVTPLARCIRKASTSWAASSLGGECRETD